MFNLQEFYAEIADNISTMLESFDQELDYSIQPQIGTYRYQPKQGRIRRKNNPIITGTLIARQNELVPIKDYDVFTFTSSLVLLPPKPIVEKVFNDVSAFVAEYNATTLRYTMDGTVKDLLITMESPVVVNVDQRAGAGSSGEIRLFITFLVFGAGVMGNDVNIAIEYEENGETKTEPLVYLQSAVQKIKTYEADNIGNREYALSVPSSQALTLTVKVAYRKTTQLMAIVSDLFSGRLDKTYTVLYSDGAAILADSPVRLNLSVGQCTLSNAPGVISSIDMVLYLAEYDDNEDEASGSGGASTVPGTNPSGPPSIVDYPTEQA